MIAPINTHLFYPRREWPTLNLRPGQIANISLCERCGALLVTRFLEQHKPNVRISDVFAISPEGKMFEPQDVPVCIDPRTTELLASARAQAENFLQEKERLKDMLLRFLRAIEAGKSLPEIHGILLEVGQFPCHRCGAGYDDSAHKPGPEFSHAYDPDVD